MTGQVLDYSFETNSGIISGDDGNRYTFTGPDWNETANPSRGMRVDFEAQGPTPSPSTAHWGRCPVPPF